jgi:GT2 family glycosyltransferase
VLAQPPTLSVVLPSRNRCAKLGQVLEGLCAQEYGPDVVETVVILDGSEDDSAEYVRAAETPFSLRLIQQENRGLAATRNRGARESQGDVIVFLDDDTVPRSDFLAAHAAAHADSAVDRLVLGYYPPVPSSDTLWAQVLRTWWEDHFRRKAEPGHLWTYVDFAGGNSSFTRRLFVGTGGFDEAFRGRREDWEYAVRLLERGVPFAYQPGAVAFHFFDTSLETGLRHERQHARDDVLIGLKHPGVRSQLPLAALSDHRPSGSERLEAEGQRRARLYEAIGLRPRWRSLVHELLANAYALGLHDALPTEAAYLDFFAPIWRNGVRRTRVDLAAPRAFATPEGLGSIELEVAQGEFLGSVVPIDPGGQWEWAAVADRLADRLSSPARRAELLAARNVSSAR